MIRNGPVQRPRSYGVAAAGEPGVARALAILREEAERVMFFIGCPGVAALSRSYLRERPWRSRLPGPSGGA